LKYRLDQAADRGPTTDLVRPALAPFLAGEPQQLDVSVDLGLTRVPLSEVANWILVNHRNLHPRILELA